MYKAEALFITAGTQTERRNIPFLVEGEAGRLKDRENSRAPNPQLPKESHYPAVFPEGFSRDKLITGSSRRKTRNPNTQGKAAVSGRPRGFPPT